MVGIVFCVDVVRDAVDSEPAELVVGVKLVTVVCFVVLDETGVIIAAVVVLEVVLPVEPT